MLSGQAYSFGKKARLAVSLAWVGGYIDVVGFLQLRIYTSNMTGNTAMIGQRVAEGFWRNALYVYFLVTMFLLGAMLAGVLMESARRAHLKSVYTIALAVEALLLSLAVLYLWLGGSNVYVMGLLPAAAMGLQNATVTRISGAVVRTTHVTGIVTDLGLESVQFWFYLWDRARLKRVLRFSAGGLPAVARLLRATQRHPTFQRLVLLGGIWTTFVLGAALGGGMWYRLGGNAMLIPAVFLVFMILLERLTPLASIDAVERAARAKSFLAYGIEPDLVPDSIGLYQVGGSAGRRKLRPPDLGEFPLLVRSHEQIVILVLSPHVDLDHNCLIGLTRSLLELRLLGKHLIVCPDSAELYRAILASDFYRDLGAENLASDPEFAVARALDLTQNHGENR